MQFMVQKYDWLPLKKPKFEYIAKDKLVLIHYSSAQTQVKPSMIQDNSKNKILESFNTPSEKNRKLDLQNEES
jgi:hypothetical protein